MESSSSRISFFTLGNFQNSPWSGLSLPFGVLASNSVMWTFYSEEKGTTQRLIREQIVLNGWWFLGSVLQFFLLIWTISVLQWFTLNMEWMLSETVTTSDFLLKFYKSCSITTNQSNSICISLQFHCSIKLFKPELTWSRHQPQSCPCPDHPCHSCVAEKCQSNPPYVADWLKTTPPQTFDGGPSWTALVQAFGQLSVA